jgi:hypothetical protein
MKKSLHAREKKYFYYFYLFSPLRRYIATLASKIVAPCSGFQRCCYTATLLFPRAYIGGRFRKFHEGKQYVVRVISCQWS